MSKYPPVIGASNPKMSSMKQHRSNMIYGNAIATTKPARLQPRQTKGPNMFKRMIKGLVTWSMTDHSDREEISLQPDHETRISATGIRFEVYRANGGTVIETRRQDRRSGDSIYELHVISGEQDVGAEIGKIITMESLKA
jgi:hypothetical protein